MKSLISFTLMSLVFSGCYAMEKSWVVSPNPFALLAVDDDCEIVADEVEQHDAVAAASVERQPLTLFDIIRGKKAKALEGLRDAFAHGYDVNAQSREGKNTILHAALMLPSLECAYCILCEKWHEVDTSLKNRNQQTVLDLAYQRLARLTVSVKLGNDSRGHFYSVVRDRGVVFKDRPRHYDIQQQSVLCGMDTVDMYTFVYGGTTYCFESHPLHSVVLASRTLKQVFQVGGAWRGWVDMVYELKKRGRVRMLIDIIESLGGSEIGFAHFLFK